jgi:hypothetical protein
MRRFVLLIWSCLLASPAFAQSTYVAAAVGADITRSNRSDTYGISTPNFDAEPLSLTVKAGTGLGERWGVELGWVKARRTHATALDTIRYAVTTGSAVLTTVPAPAPLGVPIGRPFFFEPRIDVYRRHTSVEAVAWADKRVADRVDLAFLGGVSFNRTSVDTRIEFNIPILAQVFLPPGLSILPPQSTHIIDYSVAPVAGVDARIELARHVRVIPSLRLQGVSGEWLLQPSAGLAWVF